MAVDKGRKSNVATDTAPTSKEHRAGHAQVSLSEGQYPPGETQRKSVPQQHGEQQKRAQESQGDGEQNVGLGESKTPMQARLRAGAPFQPRGRYRKR